MMIASNTPANERLLRQVVADRLDIHWTQFEREHPHLAAAIERVRLIDSTVNRIADDPAYAQAMAGAAQDEGAMDVMESLSAIADRWLKVVLGL